MKNQYTKECISNDKIFAEAKSLGMKVSLPDDFCLQIDIDDVKNYDIMKQRLIELQNFGYNPKIIKDIPSKSGLPHRHVYIDIEVPFDSLERIFLQLYLGSDSKRELLNFERVQAKEDYPIIFFEEK